MAAMQGQHKDIDPNKNDQMRVCTYKNAKSGAQLQIYVNPHLAFQYQNGDIEWDSKTIVQSDLIFSNAKAGEQASKATWQSMCDTEKKAEAFKFLVDNGTINLTQAERQKLQANAKAKSDRLNDKK